MHVNLEDSRGFSLTEILVALLLASLLSTGIYKVYISQNKSYVVQERVAEMHQNLRVAMFMMTREIRMACYDPTGDAGAEISTADQNNIQFSMDVTEDGAIVPADGEDITYVLYDSDGDGNADALGRDIGGGIQLLAENIDALDFIYLDGEGAVLPTPVDNPASIRTIQITVVASADFKDPDYTDNTVYKNQQDVTILDMGAQSDDDRHKRRKRLTTQIRCRNLGL